MPVSVFVVSVVIDLIIVVFQNKGGVNRHS